MLFFRRAVPRNGVRISPDPGEKRERSMFRRRRLLNWLRFPIDGSNLNLSPFCGSVVIPLQRREYAAFNDGGASKCIVF